MGGGGNGDVDTKSVAPALKKGGKGFSFVYFFSPLVSHHQTALGSAHSAPLPSLHIPQAPPAPAAKAPFMILTKAAKSQRVSAMSTQFIPRFEQLF